MISRSSGDGIYLLGFSPDVSILPLLDEKQILGIFSRLSRPFEFGQCTEDSYRGAHLNTNEHTPCLKIEKQQYSIPELLYHALCTPGLPRCFTKGQQRKRRTLQLQRICEYESCINPWCHRICEDVASPLVFPPPVPEFEVIFGALVRKDTKASESDENTNLFFASQNASWSPLDCEEASASSNSSNISTRSNTSTTSSSSCDSISTESTIYRVRQRYFEEGQHDISRLQEEFGLHRRKVELYLSTKYEFLDDHVAAKLHPRLGNECRLLRVRVRHLHYQGHSVLEIADIIGKSEDFVHHSLSDRYAYLTPIAVDLPKVATLCTSTTIDILDRLDSNDVNFGLPFTSFALR
jgi:hypothetical protein